MSWFPEQKLTWYERFCCNVIKSGKIPRHVAFIMDGNRRFASKCSMVKMEGHLKGFDKLAQSLEWCLELGIREVTVYAFSIENFNRPREEVDGLMKIAREKFEVLMKEKDKLEKHGVCVRIIGNLTLLPRDLQKMMAELILMTEKNNQSVLNVCFSYTSREEIATSVKEIVEGVQQGFLEPSDVSKDLIGKCLYTNKSADPDLLIRTSGETRLSDFLLWQSAYTTVSFVEVLWPEFKIWHLFGAVLLYQLNLSKVQVARSIVLQDEQDCTTGMNNKRITEALRGFKGSVATPGSDIRIDKFLDHLNEKRENILKNMYNFNIDSMCSNQVSNS